MSRSMKSLPTGLLAALACSTALAQIDTAARADRLASAPLFPQSEFRAALSARGHLLASFVNTQDLAFRTDAWTATFEALGPAERASVMQSLQAASHPRDLMGLLVSELPTRLALQASGAPQLKFGSADTGELVYKPTLPCRVADTRFWTGGSAVQSGKTRQIYVYSASPLYAWSNQGGTGTPGSGDCALSYFSSGAPIQVLANVTVVNPSNAGNARTYSGGTTLPATSTVNFVAGQTVANAIAVPVDRSGSPNPTTDAASQGKRDIGVYLDNTTADVIIDVIGYFVAPTKSTLDCYTTAEALLINQYALGYKSLQPTACDAGYSVTGTFCSVASGESAALLSNGYGGLLQCEWNQTQPVSTTYRAKSRCCRLP